ncbi:two-component regulator propeller domain-containing protein [Roseivirga sp. BDSF3-8]|uniref:hybrid sensor histidine kinase/response regulator transcription factor n=1 Tax=Roseivirga sp. BDSF3-8 TaxID=3241598 RepID=UPI00353270AD
MKKSAYILPVMALWLTAAVVFGQNRSMKFQYLTIEDGLSQNMVDCILQDRQGFLWVGTWNGLCRYDGYGFKVYNNENAQINNFIHALYEDAFGNIWAGTREGLFVYLHDEQRFAEASGLVSGQEGIGGKIKAIEPLSRSTALVITDSRLYVIEFLDSGGHWKSRKQYATETLRGKIKGQVLNTATGAYDGSIWAGTDQGITIIRNGAYTYIESAPGGLSSNQVLALHQASDSTMWIGTEWGLNRYESATGTFSQFFHNENDPATLPHSAVMDLAENENGQLLVATLGGIGVMDSEGRLLRNYTKSYYSDQGLNNNFVNCLLLDRDQNIWIGTERGGLNLLNTHQSTFEHFEHKITDPNSLSHSTVNSVFEDDRNIWIGTAGGGLNKYVKATGKYRHYTFRPEDTTSLSSNFVTVIHRDQKGKLWAGTWGAGLNLMADDQSGRFRRFMGEYLPGPQSTFISSVAEDHTGNLWIGTLGGLIFYDTEGERFERKFNIGPDRISEVGTLLIDSEGNLWVGTRAGLYRVSHPASAKPEVAQYTHRQEASNSLSGNYVISLLQDSRGSLWVGTYGQGINKFNSESETFTNYTTRHGLGNNIVYAMEEDGEGNLWLSTDYGLSSFDPETSKFRNFYTSNGLLNNQYYWSASFKNARGKLYFGGMQGLDAFYPAWINEQTAQSEVVLTNIKLLNETVTPGRKYHGTEALGTSPMKAEELNLSYREKNFTIEFTTLDFQEPEMIRYAYILEGFEKDWHYVGSDRRFASYTNLKPGDYTFKVKASDPNGDFTQEARSLAIHIQPPFWDTTWFRILFVLLLAGMVLGYIRWRTYSLKRQKILLEKQVMERTEQINHQNEELSAQAAQLKTNNEELETKQALIRGQKDKLEQQNREILSQRDKLIALNKKVKLVSQLRMSFFTNVSHEFRTPLTLILGPLQKLIKDRKVNEEVLNTLNLINHNAQRLLHLINQIMDFRKVENGQMDLKVTSEDMNAFCYMIFEAFRSLAELKNIRYSYIERDLPDEVWFDKEKMEHVLYNLLSNAFKYTPEGGRISFEVQGLKKEEARLETGIKGENGIISLRVSDSGIGISEENLPLVFKRFYRVASEKTLEIGGSGVGLSLAEALIRSHHGEIFVESNVGQGSVFEVQFPCLKSAYTPSEIEHGSRKGPGIMEQIEFFKDELMGNAVKEHTVQPMAYTHRKGRSTVLIVEDNNDLRTFVASRLNEQYNILEAGNGRIGAELARKNDPDIIISDIMMPEMNGHELCTHLKQHLDTSHIPVILLTAKSSVEDQIEGLEIGADAYLPKPFNFDLLAATIQNLIDGRNKLRMQFASSSDADSVTSNSKDKKFLESAIDTVNENLQDPSFDVGVFVKKMGISRSLLHKKLTSLTNQSASEFINHLRMQKAKSLLEGNTLNISEVAYASGYNDPKYFSRLFKKHFGQSPKEFVEQKVRV